MSNFPVEGSLPFRYTTVARLREEGLSSTVVSDARALDLIDFVSSVINDLTAQWFNPILVTEVLDGRGFQSIRHPAGIPFLEVFDVKIISRTLESFLKFDLDDFSLSKDRRSLRREPLTPLTGVDRAIAESENILGDEFPEEFSSVQIRAAWGWLENLKFVRAETLEPVDTGSVSVRVDDRAGIVAGDVVLFEDDDGNQARAVVSSVNESAGPELEFDPIPHLESPVATGATVYDWGRVPRGIEKATILLVNDERHPLASSQAQQMRAKKELLSERTDNYSYRRAAPSGGDLANRTNSSGNARVDNILNNFTAPPYYGAV